MNPIKFLKHSYDNNLLDLFCRDSLAFYYLLKLSEVLVLVLKVRQYASVLLRRKILKANQWGAVPANICQE